MLNNYLFNGAINKYSLDDNGGGEMFTSTVSGGQPAAAGAAIAVLSSGGQSQQMASGGGAGGRTSQSIEPAVAGIDGEMKEHPNSKRKHCVWDYYDLRSGKAQCRTCFRFISATTTLAKGHLKAFHPGVLAEVEQKEEHRRELQPVGTAPKRRKTPQLSATVTIQQQQHPMQQQMQSQHMQQQQQMLGGGDGSEAINAAAQSAALFDSKPYDTKPFRRTTNLYGQMSKLAGPPPACPVVQMRRTETFSAAHRLHNPDYGEQQNRDVYGACNNPNGHGHNYEWTAVLEGPVCAHTGMVYDLVELKRAMADVQATVDHKHLDLDLDYFRNRRLVSTTENLCVYLYDQLKDKLKRPELLKKIVVAETNKNRFSYTGG